MAPLVRHKSIDEKYNKGTTRVESMDFKTTKDSLRAAQGKLVPLADVQKDQERKAREAAEYRANILKEKQGDNLEMSPAYGREKASLLRTKKQLAEDKEAHEGKATFAQCIFNLANILMVRLTSNMLMSNDLFYSSATVHTTSLPITCVSGSWLAGSSIRIRQGWHGWRHVCNT